MEPAKGFDPYEIIGIIAPGTIVALLLVLEAPLFRSVLSGKGFSVGDFGLFVMLAFVLGHLVQAFGNLIEWVVWIRGGLPTNQVRPLDQALLSPAQRLTLQAKASAMEAESFDLSAIPATHWRAVTTRAYARVRTAGRSARIDVANRNYGMCRGLAAALLLALGWCSYAHLDERGLLGALLLLIGAAVWRMRRAGFHYARALFLEFIDLEVAAPNALVPLAPPLTPPPPPAKGALA